jgi:hypothetical protein
MTFGRIAALLGVALLVLVVNVGISILYMVVYGHVIAPGHEEAYYQEHVQIAAPYCSIVAGIPLMFLAGWWVSRSREAGLGIRAALIVWLTYAAIDLGILAAFGITPRIAALTAVSLLTKLAAVYAGSLVSSRPA